MRKLTFTISFIIHLVFFYWIVTTPISLDYDQEKNHRTVIPVVLHKLFIPGEIGGNNGRTNHAGKQAPSFQSPTQKNKKIDSLRGKPLFQPLNPLQTPTPLQQLPGPQAKLPANPPLQPALDLSLSSPRIQGILKSFNSTNFNGSSDSQPDTTPGTKGRAQFIVKNIDLKSWGRRALISIQKNWDPPLAAPQETEIPIEIELIVQKNGDVSSINVKKSCLVDTVDAAAINAIKASSPFPPLPPGFPVPSIAITFIFTSHNP